eukprot:TRINITY_DN12758_c0_g1_i1.p1 TRINITY_DN12758_c0_g1~~TRINITY_DN12758_c0_g1_i1.p1  ORF type:complete len:150 (-),score=33.55 TRINITY_DN12758_c0_g1_i1:19-468(-)
MCIRDSNQQALARLRKAVEGAKRRLSSHPEARVEVDGIVEGFDLSERLTRGKFEELCMDLFKGTLEPVKGVLADSQLSKEEVDEVVLVGGSTRIPKVQNLIREFFNGKEPNRCLLYTSDAADEEDSVDLCGRRVIKKKKQRYRMVWQGN